MLITSAGTTELIRTSPNRLFGPDGLSLPGSDQGGTATGLSVFNRFAKQNADLLSIIDQDPALLERALSAGFKERSDLLEILADGVASTLPQNSPITRRFLAENSEVTSLLALNLGGLRDRVIADPALAASLVDGTTIQDAIVKEVAQAASQAVSSRGGLDEAYFTEHPLAAAYLLGNDAEARRIAADATGAAGDGFRSRFSQARSPIREVVVSRASALLQNPTAYSSDYLRRDETFTSLLVGATELGSPGSLAGFLQQHQDLTLERVDVSVLLRSYEVDRAVRQIPTGGVLNEEFLSANVGLALVINRSPEARQALIDDLPRLNALQERVTRPDNLANGDAIYDAFVKKTSADRLVNFYF